MDKTCAYAGKGCVGTPSLRITFTIAKHGYPMQVQHRLVCGRCFGKAMTAGKKWIAQEHLDPDVRVYRRVEFSGLSKQ